VATEATLLAQEPIRPGNSNRPDPYQAAKRQYRLGQLAQKRDALEARHERWQRVAEKLGGTVRRLREWKGRKLPYTFGVVDVSVLLYAIDYLGVGEFVSVTGLRQMAQTLFMQ
jgi:hypothetical protein